MLQRWTSLNIWFRLAILGLLAAALSIGWYLGSPLFINRVVHEDFPVGLMADADMGMGEPAAAMALGSGRLGTIDAIHKGTGTATLFALPDGQHILRFEDFEVQNGPDLFVYLSGHPAPRDSSQLHEGGAFEVGRLKGNIGNQNYTLPADLDLSPYKSVVIYCKRFSVVFSTAELAPDP